MSNKIFSSILIFFFSAAVYAQKNFQFSPAKPKAGEVITFTYEPAGDISNAATIDAVAQISTTRGEKAEELTLTKQGNNYSGKIVTDTNQHFLYLLFSSDDKIDNNFNEGYWIQLYDGDKVKKGANLSLMSFYMYNQAGVEKNYEKALKYVEQEMSLYPETRKQYLSTYINLLTSIKKDEKQSIIQKEIENLLKGGLKTEEDYSALQSLYSVASLPEQNKFVDNLKKEKFPHGKWLVMETERKFFNERDPVKKEQMLADMMKKTETDEMWKGEKETLERNKSVISYAYLGINDWDGMKKAIMRTGLKEDAAALVYHSAAAKILQIAGIDTVRKYGEEFGSIAASFGKKRWKDEQTEKPAAFTKKQWQERRANTYAAYANTYASILYKLGEYKKGIDFARDAAIVINNGRDPKLNNTYALLAEKVLPAKKYTKELEQFVKDAKATDSIYAILKRNYIKEKKTDAGFEVYIVALQKEKYEMVLAHLRKSMINQTAPPFAVSDIDGNKVNLAGMKGKVVVLDFWATWCGPCIGSFPAMQKMVNKYKNNSDVKFFFVDTYERVVDKKKKVSDFINENKYKFDILMDEDNKVSEQYKVVSIPHKFVIDKNGMIRFKALGFDGGDDGLINELSAMIELAGRTE